MFSQLHVSVPNENILEVKSERGVLRTVLKYHDLDRGDGSHRVVRWDPQFYTKDDTHSALGKLRDYIARVKEAGKSNVYTSHPLHYCMMTARYFENQSDTYAKVLVKLDRANINDTISFRYADRRYEAFIREIVPVGLDWFAVAFVVERSPPDKPIIIDQHTIVNVKRVIRVGADAFSMKDIVRMVRGDPEKTEKLKEIVADASIDNAEKLKRASALV